MPYPRQHARLWQEVGERGLLLSEWPPATTPDAFRFPLRNRLIAALSEIVVVVESRETGGSMSTVAEALARGVDVMAVPGSVRIRAAAGTNQLIRDGAAPVTSVDDILDVLGLNSIRHGNGGHDRRPRPDHLGVQVLELCAVEPRTLAGLVEVLHHDLSMVALAVARLERDGWLIETGGWLQVGGPWAGLP
jgi:DNA processing protein